jgi:hypothetical protein
MFLLSTALVALDSAGLAADGLPYYKWLRSLETSVVEAIEKRSASQLSYLGALLLEDGSAGPPAKFCSTASAHLAAAALVYSGMLDPKFLGPSTTQSESAQIGDQTWAEYVTLVRSCEQSIGILATEARRSRLSDLGR